MKLFLDTANFEEIEEINSWGVLDGVTTNPTLLAKEAAPGKDYKQMLKEICAEVDGPVSAEVVSTDTEGMLREARDLVTIADNIYVKFPCTTAGLAACKTVRGEGVRVNMTLVFSPAQALLAAKAGANFISPFLGRIDDIASDGMDILAQCIEVVKNYDFSSEILASSLRGPMHVVEAARLGSDIATMPHSVFAQLIKHPLTDIGLERFIADWEKAKKDLERNHMSAPGRPGRGRSGRGRGPRRGTAGPRPRRVDLGLPNDDELEGEIDVTANGAPARTELEQMDVGELMKLAEEVNVTEPEELTKPQMVDAILSRRAEDEGFLYRKGILDVLPDGYGFLRTQGYLPSESDVYVLMSQVRRFGLRRGDEVSGVIRPPKDAEKYYALLRIENVNGLDPEVARRRPSFDKLTALFPDERLRLETDPRGFTERILDLICPIGKGQRGMVVSPPKAGKTTILKQIANAWIENNPEVHVIVLLVDERPEEVTDWRRTVKAAEVVASTFDRPADDHIQVTELVLERSKRLVEGGADVAILCDSITRMARAYNLAAPASGKILSGGVDSTALYPPKRFFGAARNIEEGGSLTIIASCLVETGSRMDEVIFEEFKGTGNMEVRLDRTLAEKRLFPAINVEGSGTRKEELLMGEEELMLAWRLRRVLHALDPAQALELLIDKMKQTRSNAEFLKEIAKANN